MNTVSARTKETVRMEMEGYAKDWKIFLDTCSILSAGANTFWLTILPLLQQYNNKVIIPLRSIEELEKHAANSSKPDLARNAADSLKSIVQLQRAGYVEIRGEASDNFADNVFQVVFTKFRMHYRLLLITQDNHLAEDIFALNNNKSVRAFPVSVRRINRDGSLGRFSWDPSRKAVPAQGREAASTLERSRPSGAPERSAKGNPAKSKTFCICQKVTDLEDTPIDVTYVPAEGDKVFAGIPGRPSAKRVEYLKEKVSAGGEGIIYSTSCGDVAKIYKKEHNTKRKREKIRRMIEKPIHCEGVCYPITDLYNSKGEFVGYLMPRAQGKELQKSIFIKPLFLKNFPGWKKRDTVELCITILKKIEYLHRRNIIMGDINPANILVVSPKEVYFVDTDSYQIEDLPCPVGTVNYTAPEIQRKRFSDFLRSMGNENFAVATLLFMIMLPGKPPYSQQGGENQIDNIIKMDFSYPFGESSNRKTPDGPWRFIWSHLTYEMKDAFYNTFRKDGKYASEDTRLSAGQWLPIFTRYLELLDSGKFGQQDKMSEELFPTRHKKNPNINYVVCRLCHQEFPESQCQEGICRDCLSKGETYRCKRCGKEILYTNYQKYIKKAKRYDMCPECFEYGNAVRLRQTCTDCGRTFEITNSQYEYYKRKGFEIPKRCKACREAKKENPYGSHSAGGSSSYSGSSYGGSSSKGGFCFLTTAVCEYFGKPDDCPELTALRGYRDGWLKNQPDGPALIAEYYRIAPLIVSRMKASENFGLYCERLWSDYIKPCLSLIAAGQYEACKHLYIEMVEYTRREFM